MAEVLSGKETGDQLVVSENKTQAYGLSGNDTLFSDGKNEVLLIGGSGDDSLIMMGGVGTLNGGKGSDTFEFTYSADKPISAIIEDLNPMDDKIIVNFDGNTRPQFSSVASGNDVVWKDGNGLFNLTLKSVRDNDYFDGSASEEVWEVLRLTNDEREKQSGEDGENRPTLTLSEGLTKGAAIRAKEITSLGEIGALTDHTRPNGEPYHTVLNGKYNFPGENLDSGAESPSKVMQEWMNSEGHKANILNKNFSKLGVGYNYNDEDSSNLRYYWTQLFAKGLKSSETVSAANLSSASLKTNRVSKSVTGTAAADTIGNSDYGTTINAAGGNDSISNTGLLVSISGGEDKDTINNSSDNVTINGGKGNDVISLSSSAKNNLIEYHADDGSDTVNGFNETDTLSISDSEYTSVTVGNDLVIAVGNDSIKLLNAAKLPAVKIYGTWGKRVILSDSDDDYKNLLDGITLSASDGNDTIRNGENDSTLGANVSINAGDGNDYIRNRSMNVTINAGAGDDTVNSYYNDSLTVDLGAGNDSILNFHGSKASIVGDAGDDIPL